MKRVVVKLTANFVAGEPAMLHGASAALSLHHGKVLGDIDRDITTTIKLPDLSDCPDSVARGTELMDLLRSSPSVDSALAIALGTAGPGPIPLYVYSCGNSDLLPWEQLHDDVKKFCTLDRWPVARIARGPGIDATRQHNPPTRFVAVLAAALPALPGSAHPGHQQLNTLASAVKEAPFDAHLHIISGHDAVLTRARQLSRQCTRISVEQIGGDVNVLLRQIQKANPHVLHILSHGAQDMVGRRCLNLANLVDVDAESERGSIDLTAQELALTLRKCSPWLVVLASCESAAVSTHSPAFARDLIGLGIPAIIGMQRPVDVVVMNKIARGVYPELISLIDAALHKAANGTSSTLDWSSALTPGRTAILASNDDRWSQLALYSHPSRLQLAVTAKGSALNSDKVASLRGELDMRQRYRDQLSPDAPEGVVATVDDAIARIKRQLNIDD